MYPLHLVSRAWALFALVLGLCCAALPAPAAVVINELMVQPAGVPENPAEEWIELFNNGTAAVDLTNWRFTKGISFTFPATSLPAGGFIVLASNAATFQASHPGLNVPLVGGWTGKLSNSGETLRLESATGDVIQEVSYADEGEWALRARGVLDYSHRGWMWLADHAGTGKTLELINPSLAAENTGQNWAVSLTVGGTPGAANSAAASNIAPLILQVHQRPAIPRSVDPIIISARLVDEESTGATCTLRWRLDGTTTFSATPMADPDGDGILEATIPPQTNGAIIEFYLEAADTGGRTRTLPAPTRVSNPEATTAGYAQATNYLLQVDNNYDPAVAWVPGDRPIYHFIMLAAEKTELARIGSNVSTDHLSDALMNATFISQDGLGLHTRYLCGLRNRGFGSRIGPPNNYHVAIPHDRLWFDRSSFQANCRYPHCQVLGTLAMERAGLPTQDSAPIRIRVNGVDLAETNLRMYGSYARNEGINGDWLERHFPHDSQGNLYRLDDHAPNTPGVIIGDLGSGEFRYEGTNPAAYSDTFLKDNHADLNDWSDLLNLTTIISAPVTGGTVAQPAIPDEQYVAALGAVVNIDEFMTMMATDALIGNQEGGLQSGRSDDATIYRGVVDPRFILMPHDLDSGFGLGLIGTDPGGPGAGPGTGNPVTRSIFSYEGVLGFTRLFNHPQLAPRYYAKVLEQMDAWFNHPVFDPLIDDAVGGWVPAATVAGIKTYIDQRRANVLAQIPQTYSLDVTTSGPEVDGIKRTVDGAVTFSGSFHVARTYSVTVNGLPAQLSYRTGTYAAGTWRLALPAGNALLQPGRNRITVIFWDGVNGSGRPLQTLTTDVLNQPLTPVFTGAGTLRLLAPANYIPGKPFSVRVDRLDAQGQVDRTAWDTTVELASNVTGYTLPAVQLYNGTGSALVTLGGAGGAAVTQFVQPGGTLAVPNASAPLWRMLDSGAAPTVTWKSDAAFDDSLWKQGPLQAGAGDGDERTVLANVPGSATNTRRAFYFRTSFDVADPSAYGGLTIKAVVDDGAVFYLNGTEILRDNMPAGTPTLTTAGSTNRSGTAEALVRTFDVSANLPLLRAGSNLLAVEVHNYGTGATYSEDLSFDCELDAVPPAADPGNITLTAAAPGLMASRAVASLGTAATMQEVTGTLPVETTTWSGVIHVTGDVTVPVGGTLILAAGTQVLLDGDATAGSAAGKRIIINGALQSQGTFNMPVSLGAFGAADRWGGLLFSAAQPSTLAYTLLNRAGHTTGVGHTGRGPALRLASSSLTMTDSTMSDVPGKAMYSSGTCDLVIQRSLIERTVTGPELDDGISLLIEDSNIQRVLPDYRESNAAAPDDEDCLYVHNTPGRSVVIRRSVFARCGDDLFDCLGGPIVVQDSILREAWDKGMSLLNNDLTISGTQIVRCDKAIVPKSNAAVQRTINASNCTIIAENHDTSKSPWGYAVATSDADPDSPSTGFYTQNKSGQSNTGATISITATNCIVIAQQPVLVDAPYAAANTVVTYSDLLLDTGVEFAWPGTGNLSRWPGFVNQSLVDLRLTAASPARDSGNPATALDADGTRADMGALPYFTIASGTTLTWTPTGGPYVIKSDLAIPAGTTLVIQPGTSVYFEAGRRLTVQGQVVAQGTPGAHITFSHIPGSVAVGDCDPIKNGVQTGPAKWGGVRVVDALGAESIFSYCDFINAQGNPQPQTAANFAGDENWGALGFIRSWGKVDHCTWSGTHLRMCYGRNARLTVMSSDFPDMFGYDAALGREEIPSDFPATADDYQEPLRIEYPITDVQVAGQAGYSSHGMPLGGWLRVYYNDFHGNKGHNDVFDVDSGRLGTAGDFILDCRYNYFHGLAGDEHIDLGGDTYIASNTFERATKDVYTSDRGYSNAISSGDKGTGTTIMVARNRFFDLDHAVNCKAKTAIIFEHNTVANIHPDFVYDANGFLQTIKDSAINLFVPEDTNPTAGDGAYLGFNIFSSLPRLISGADNSPAGLGSVTSRLQFNRNLVDAVADLTIGPNHPGSILDGTYGLNLAGTADFANAAMRDFSLRPGSMARGLTAGEFDLGTTVPEWAYILGGPGASTRSRAATFVVGGPGLVAYQWRLDGGAWSNALPIGDGGTFSRTAPTVRQVTLTLSNLANGSHTLEVIGQDMAGNWQNADPAREAAAQAAPTKRQWLVDPTTPTLRLNEVLAASNTNQSDRVEIYNSSETAVSLSGWYVSDDPANPQKFPLPAINIPAGGYASPTLANLALDRDGDMVLLYEGAVLRDSVSFGPQVPDLTVGRVGEQGNWALCQPTFGAANVAQRLGDAGTLRINEWFSDGSVLYDDDWIELANAGSLPVALTGLQLTDNRYEHAESAFPALSFVGAGGFARFLADGKASSGGAHLGFSLDAQSQNIVLLDATGALLDSVIYYPQVTDRSQGRDTTGKTVFYELPTRGFANGSGDPAYANALALLRGLRITEIMYNPVGGSDYEYIELTNTGTVPLSLAGVQFVAGVDYLFPSVVLLAGQRVLVVANIAKFRSRYGAGPNVAGAFTGKLDNSGEAIGLQLPPPFDAKVMSFTYQSAWQGTANGLGKSLVIADPPGGPSSWNDYFTWGASASSGGDPDGFTIYPPDHYAAWRSYYGLGGPAGDPDGDGKAAGLEFALGTDPTSRLGFDGTASLPNPALAAGAKLELHFWLPENLATVQTQGQPEATYRVLESTDLVAWSTIATKTAATAWSGTATVLFGTRVNGYVPVTVQSGGTGSPRYLRLEVSLP